MHRRRRDLFPVSEQIFTIGSGPECEANRPHGPKETSMLRKVPAALFAASMIAGSALLLGSWQSSPAQAQSEKSGGNAASSMKGDSKSGSANTSAQKGDRSSSASTSRDSRSASSRTSQDSRSNVRSNVRSRSSSNVNVRERANVRANINVRERSARRSGGGDRERFSSDIPREG